MFEKKATTVFLVIHFNYHYGMIIFELLVTVALVTLIWIIQVLHYPSFLFVDKNDFSRFEAFHTKRISIVVIPLMVSELILGLINLNYLILGIIVLIWLSTFFIQVPCHDKLKFGFDRSIIERLVLTNWIRTALWSIKLVLLLVRWPW
jgi:hypothetical protein